LAFEDPTWEQLSKHERQSVVELVFDRSCGCSPSAIFQQQNYTGNAASTPAEM
jgi:hypothetical protein